MEIANTGALDATSSNYRLQFGYSSGGTCNGSETYADVPTSSSTSPWLMTTSGQYSNGATTTSNLLTAVGTFTNGIGVAGTSNQTGTFDLPQSDNTEFEYAIKATSNATDYGTYCFRLNNVGSSGGSISSSVYPQITLAGGGGRLFSSGFEMQSATAGVEWSNSSGVPAISTSTVRSGLASLQISSLVSATQQGLGEQFAAANATGTIFARTYLYISADPSAENRVIALRDSGGTDRAYITLSSTSSLRLYDSNGVIGSPSSALSLNTWYMVELKIDVSETSGSRVVEARLNGSVFATTSSSTVANGPELLWLGGNLNGEAQTTGTWYFDDVAVNQNSGLHENGYPGAGSIVDIIPINSGDTASGCSGTWSNVDSVPPTDSSPIECSSAGNTVDLALNSPEYSGIRSSDTISLVAVTDRFEQTGTTGTFYDQLESTPTGTLATSSTITPTTSYTTNAPSAPFTPPITSYNRPEGGAWTASYVRTAQVGTDTVTSAGGGKHLYHSVLWLMVEYTPATNAPTNLVQYNSVLSVLARAATTTDGVSTDLYLTGDAISSFISDIITPNVEVRTTSTSFTNSSTATGTSIIYNPHVPPDGRSSCIVYDSANEQLIKWGGDVGDATKAPTNDTWALSLKPNMRSQWTLLATSGTKPQDNYAQVCVYDSLNKRLVVFGGYDAAAPYLTSAWFLSLPTDGSAPTWTNPAVSGTPPNAGQVLQGMAVYDALNDRMITYGGFQGSTEINTVYELTLPSTGTPTWTNLGLTTGPSATGQGRDTGCMVYDSTNQRAIMYGGEIGTTIVNELWSLNLTSGSEAWTQFTPSGGPGVRYKQQCVFQPNYSGSDGRMISYGGGNGTSAQNDIWQLTLPANLASSTWTNETPLDTYNLPMANYLATDGTGVYDPNGPNGPRALLLGGYDGTNFTNDRIMAIDLPTTGPFKFQDIVDVHSPTARDGARMTFDTKNNQIVYFGGSSGVVSGPAYAYHNDDTWLFNVNTNTWRDAGADEGPPVREFDNILYDASNTRAVMCLGLNNVANYMDDCWAESLPSSGASVWTNLNATGTAPAGKWGAAAVYDSLNHRVVFFGGEGPAGTYRNDVDILSLPSGGGQAQWMTATTSGTAPTGRRFPTAVYDSVNQRMVIFGGETSGTAATNQVWSLTLPSGGGTLVWSQLSPSGTAPSARRSESILDPNGGSPRMVIFGGWDETNALNDSWALSLGLGTETWSQLSPSGVLPFPRRSDPVAYDPVNGRLITKGGRDASTLRFFGDTWGLTLGASPSWSPIIPDIAMPVSVPVTGLTAADYHWQTWGAGSSSGTGAATSYGTSSNSIDFTIVSTSTSITVSGNAYEDDSSAVWSGCNGATADLDLHVGSTTYGPVVCSASDGSFTFSSVTAPSAGSPLIVYFKGVTSNYGSTVDRYSGSGNITGVIVRRNRVIVTHDDAGPVTNADLGHWDSASDSDIQFTVSSGALTVKSGQKLIVNTNKTFTPGGAVTTTISTSSASIGGNVSISSGATLSMGTNALSVGGNYSNSGTFSKSSGQTTTFTATSTGFTIAPGTGNFDSVTFNGSGGGWSFSSTSTMDSNLTMTAGTLSGTSTITVSGGSVTGNGTIDLTGGTFTVSGTGNFGGSSNWIFDNLTVSGTTTATGSGSVTATGVMTISGSDSLNAAGKTWILSGSGTPLSISGTFTASTSTVDYTSTSATNITSVTYYDLNLKPSGSGSPTYTILSGTLTTNANLTVGDGTNAVTVTAAANNPTMVVAGNFTVSANGAFTASGSSSFSVGGNWSVNASSGTFTASSGTVTFNSTASGKTIDSGGQSFYNVIFNGSGGVWSALTDTTTVAGDLTMTAGTLDNSSGSANITVNGNVAGTSGTIDLTTNTFEQRVSAGKNFETTSGTAAWTFDNLTFSNSNSGATAVTITTQTGGSGGITVSGVLLVGKSGDASGATTTLNAGNRTWTLSGTGGDPFQILASPAGGLTASTSTFVYTGIAAGNTTVQAATYNVLQINGSTTYILGGSTTAGTVTITTGTLDLNSNTLSDTGDLTVNGTLQGATNVTVNGNVTGSGTVNLTGGTFDQVVAANKTFGSSSGTNGWTFSTLKFNNSDGVSAHTVTPNSGTGTITISTSLTIGDTGTKTITLDNSSANRNLAVTGSILISTEGIYLASGSGTFDLTGNFTNNGTFTAGTSTLTMAGTGSPAATFYNFTSTVAGKTLAFTAGETFRINGAFTVTGTSGSHINIQSTTSSQWFVNKQGTSAVSYATITNSGCDSSSLDISLGFDSTNGGNDGSCWLFPSLAFSLSNTSVSLAMNTGDNFVTSASTALYISTTATNGYTVTAFESGLLTHTDTVTTIGSWSGTNASPTVWTGNCISNSQCGFGYNTDNSLLTQFANSTYFAAFSGTSPGDVVAESTGPVTNATTTITYRVSVNGAQKAGTYTNTITYIITPSF